jgi:hypothetical protein
MTEHAVHDIGFSIAKQESPGTIAGASLFCIRGSDAIPNATCVYALLVSGRQIRNFAIFSSKYSALPNA